MTWGIIRLDKVFVHPVGQMENKVSAKDLLRQYKRRAPFNIAGLIEAANEVFVKYELPEIQLRTLRFYIQNLVVDRPVGSPKFARYNFRHMLQLIGARVLQDRGLKLAEAIENLDSANVDDDTLVERVAEFLEGNPPRISRNTVREKSSGYGVEASMRQLKLTDQATVLIPKTANMREALMELRTAITDLLGE